MRHIETLVGKTEMAAYSELSAWLSDAQQDRLGRHQIRRSVDFLSVEPEALDP